MSRIQLALNVDDIDAAVDFYSTLFDTAPTKRRPGYANFAVENPPVKLVLFENPDATGTLNHVGVERSSMEEVQAEADRLEAAGLTLDVEGDVVCCYARQDKHWVTGPDGQRWENYVVLADAQPELEGRTSSDLAQLDSGEAAGSAGCCTRPADGTVDAATAGAPAVPVPATAGSGCC
ncbi:ArsI/CadI family heavy metal resistance metalloenzyme [Nocardioides sp.]|uniref:ArsI/CadI family heavy metal resistance metalloenzyme n=1 Tax=Nocardioides sp. TaxID=35761 RepID=UPI003783FFCF